MIKARVIVMLREEVLDPQGTAIRNSLSASGLQGVTKIRQNKVFDVEMEEEDNARAEEKLKMICEQFLVNTVMENYTVTIL